MLLGSSHPTHSAWMPNVPCLLCDVGVVTDVRHDDIHRKFEVGTCKLSENYELR